jgi:hypothetical protein
MRHGQGFQAVVGLPHNFHISLTIDYLGDTLTEQFVIVSQ